MINKKIQRAFLWLIISCFFLANGLIGQSFSRPEFRKALEGGGRSEGAHALDEIFYTKDSYLSTQKVLLVTLAVVGVR